MTCENCIHFKVCDSGRHIGEHIDDEGVYSDGVEKECPEFKNKEDFVDIGLYEQIKKENEALINGQETLQKYIEKLNKLVE